MDFQNPFGTFEKPWFTKSSALVSLIYLDENTHMLRVPNWKEIQNYTENLDVPLEKLLKITLLHVIELQMQGFHMINLMNIKTALFSSSSHYFHNEIFACICICV